MIRKLTGEKIMYRMLGSEVSIGDKIVDSLAASRKFVPPDFQLLTAGAGRMATGINVVIHSGSSFLAGACVQQGMARMTILPEIASLAV
jgi:hypothetical protein